MDKKYVVTALCRCANCLLLYRIPTTSAEENASIYQTLYVQGSTTEVPTDTQLVCYKETNFRNSELNFDYYINVLCELGLRPGSRILDFGCSWGYGTYQLSLAGFDADAFEVSRSRARFAEASLGVKLVSPEEMPDNSYDVFFSAHVIEHVPCVQDFIIQGMRLLKPGGFMVTFTPNGSERFRSVQPTTFHRLWGFVHPQLIDEKFVSKCFKDYPHLIGSSRIDTSRLLGGRFSTEILNLDGAELVFIARKI